MISQVPALLPHYRIYLQTQTSKAEVQGGQLSPVRVRVRWNSLFTRSGAYLRPLAPGLFESDRQVDGEEHHPTPANRSIDFLINWQRLEHDL